MKDFISVLAFNLSQLLVKFLLHAHENGPVKLLSVAFIIDLIRETFSCKKQSHYRPGVAQRVPGS